MQSNQQLSYVWFDVKSIDCKIFLWKRNFFSSVWLHSKKCSRKFFKRLGCVSKNALENTFSISFPHFSQLPNKYYNRKIPNQRERSVNVWVDGSI